MNISKICYQHLKSWKNKKLIIEPITHALTNQVYKITNKKEAPHHIVFRLNSNDDKINIDRTKENIITNKLSNIGLYQNVYGYSDKYRIEEYIANSRTFQTDDFINNLLIKKLGQKIALIHNTDFGIKYDKTFIDDSLDSWVKNKHPILSDENTNWIKTELKNIPKEIVVCHNDIQHLNILTENNNLYIIDYEYAAYNYRLFDLGNLFNEFSLRYNDDGFQILNESLFDDSINLFLDNYYQNCPESFKKSYQNKEKLKKDIIFMRAVSHYLWGAWSLLKKDYTNFDYELYGNDRLKQFMHYKELYVNKLDG